MRKEGRHLELHHQANELKPLGRYVYRGLSYSVAISPEPMRIWYPVTPIQHAIMRDHPNGFYEFAWAIFKGEEPWIEGTNIIDVNHDLEYTGREQLRINAAKQAAENAIDRIIEVEAA